MENKLKSTIEGGVKFLRESQNEDGSFSSLTFSDSQIFGEGKAHNSVFPVSLIISSLSQLEEGREIEDIRQKAVQFLLSQKSNRWSFNYWLRESGEVKKDARPDDLDCTACALGALSEYDPSLIDGAVLAKIATMLTALEEKEGGPYRTWLAPSDSKEVWRDVDLAVNSNIAYFLALQEITLDNIDSLIEKAIDESAYFSPYYPSEYPIIYFISRSYKGEKAKKVVDFLLGKRDRDYKWGNPLDTALAVSSLLNFGVQVQGNMVDEVEPAIQYLINSQNDFSWKPYVFCLDPVIEEKTYYAGSSALTTAFCLEALYKFKMQISKCKMTVQNFKKSGTNNEEESVYKEVVNRARERFSALDEDLREQALIMLEKTLENDKDKQIALLPYFFSRSLKQDHNSKFPRSTASAGLGIIHNSDLLVCLGQASLYGWMAYTIYDDFLDDEGDSKLLSVANVCLRELTEIFNSVLPNDAGFTSFSKKVMDKVDSANCWEVSYCRVDDRDSSPVIPKYNDYSRLADRSLGYSLGPVAILFYLGYGEESPEIENLMEFFKHYLIARQLNDDAHDWENDLKNGHLNAVGSLVLERTKKEGNGKQYLKFNDFLTPDSISQLQQLLWKDVMSGVCSDILNHLERAQSVLQKISILESTSFSENIISPIRGSAEKALKEREESLKFLEAYKF